MDDICYLENICRTKHPLSPELADKQGIEEGNLTSIEVQRMLLLVFKPGVILE